METDGGGLGLQWRYLELKVVALAGTRCWDVMGVQGRFPLAATGGLVDCRVGDINA